MTSRPAAAGTCGAAFQLAAAEVHLFQPDVVVGTLDGKPGLRLLERIGHLRRHDRPDVLDRLEPADGVGLLLLAAPVVDVRLDDDEAVLQHQRDHAGKLYGALLVPRFQPPGGTRSGAAEIPRGVLAVAAGEAVGVVVEFAAANVLVSEIAADEAVLRFGAGDATHAPGRRQGEKPLVLGRRMLP